MTEFDGLTERFYTDPTFNVVVTKLMRLMEETKMSPYEVRDAALFAITQFQLMYGKDEMIKGLINR